MIEAQAQSGNPIDREELMNHLMKEANYYALASHLFWTLWAINMATSTAIKFGYMVGKNFYKKKSKFIVEKFFLGICANSFDCLLFNAG